MAAKPKGQSPYQALRASSKKDPSSESSTNLLIGLILQSLKELDNYGQVSLTPVNITGKSYFAFSNPEGGNVSRPVSLDLFDLALCKRHLEQFSTGTYREMPRERLSKFLYTMAMSFCCANDMRKTGDKKTPATFFECFVANIFSRELGVRPITEVDILNLDMQSKLPTDYLFDMGRGKAKIHLPVKISTRERIVQVWAHQRVLDGVYGVGRFRGVLVVITETNMMKGKRVTEVCLPDQWKLYQMFISQLKRIYYLDIPMKYSALGKSYPFIQVKPFAEFFKEKDKLISPTID